MESDESIKGWADNEDATNLLELKSAFLALQTRPAQHYVHLHYQ